MIGLSDQPHPHPRARHMQRTPRRVGTRGHLVLLLWTLGIVFALPRHWSPLAAGLVLVVGGLSHPAAVKRLFRWRWCVLFGFVILPHTLWMHESTTAVAGIPFSVTGLLIGLQMTLRAATVILVIDIFSRTVDISEVAGLLERLGLRGLGFSVGIAVNLLPSLRQSSRDAWYSLRMRGGLRAQRWQGIGYFLVTVITNALRRAEDIALAAEARAFSPDRARAQPLKRGSLDRWIVLGCGLSALGLLLIAYS